MELKEMGQALTKVKIFETLSVEQINQLLSLCTKRNLKSNETLFKKGSPSKEVAILTKGLLNVSSGPEGVLATVDVGGITGEMGVFTESPRSADVTAAMDSEIYSIKKEDLFNFMSKDADAGFKIYRNITKILSHYLRNNNMMLELSNMLDSAS